MMKICTYSYTYIMYFSYPAKPLPAIFAFLCHNMFECFSFKTSALKVLKDA